jgi:hypothetical protein
MISTPDPFDSRGERLAYRGGQGPGQAGMYRSPQAFQLHEATEGEATEGGRPGVGQTGTPWRSMVRQLPLAMFLQQPGQRRAALEAP